MSRSLPGLFVLLVVFAFLGSLPGIAVAQVPGLSPPTDGNGADGDGDGEADDSGESLDLKQDFLIWWNGLSFGKLVSGLIRVAVILFFFLAFRLGLRIGFNRLEKRLAEENTDPTDDDKEEAARKRAQTLVSLLRKGTGAVLWLIAVLLILSEIGIDLGPILAGAGIIGLALSFGSQNLVRDLISGFFIVLENQVRVGDVATINGTGGLVEKVNFRTIVLRDYSANIHIFPNGSITQIQNQTYGWSSMVLEIGVPYDADLRKALAVLKQVGDGLKADKVVGKGLKDVEVPGVSKLAASAIELLVRIKTLPGKHWQLAREFRLRVVDAFRENGIDFPFPQQTLSFLEDSHLPVRMLEGDAPTG